MRAFASSLQRHIAVGVLVAMATGLAEGLSALFRAKALDLQQALGPPLSAAVMAPAGLVIGVATASAAWWLSSAVPAVPRARSAALVATLALCLGAVGSGAAGYVLFSQRLQDESFAAHLAAFGAIVLCALLGALAWPLSRALSAAFEQLAALPERAQHLVYQGLTSLLLGALACGLLAFARFDAEPLGPLLALPYAAALCALAALAQRHGLGAPFSDARRSRWLGVAVLTAFCACAVLTSALHGAQALVASTLGPGALQAAFERATDVDRDGQSGLFGGRDCAPFDPARSSLATEIAGNRVDEDCSGRDLALAKDKHGAEGERLVSAALPAELVAPRNVFLIVIDALRADRIGLGSKRSLTPALDRLAARSVVFQAAYSQSSATRMSFPSFLSGRAPSSLRWRRQNGWVQTEKDEPMLAEHMRKHGYATGLVVNRWIYDRLTRLRRGYDAIQNTREVRGKDVAPEDANASSTARAIELVERALHKKPLRPMFLTVYYEGPHEPYVNHRDRGLGARSKSPRDRYDSEVRYVDQEVGSLLDYLAVQPELAKNSVIAVIADHGEEFGEHGGSSHGHTCYGESTHVPLIVHAPGFEPAEVSARVALTDVAPTLLALVGAPPLPHPDGRNLLAANTKSYAGYPDERVGCAIFQDQNPKGTLIESVRDGDFLYVERFGRGGSELYQTRVDAQERENLLTDAASQAALRRLRGLVSKVRIDER